jgi:serine/threonine-protein kinase SRPK3
MPEIFDLLAACNPWQLRRQLEIIHTDFKPENVMLCDPLNDRTWELPDLAALTPAPSARAAPPAPRITSSQPQQQREASAMSVSTGMTKNQRKKAKKKAKKKAAAGATGAAGDVSEDDDDDDVTTAGGGGGGGGRIALGDEEVCSRAAEGVSGLALSTPNPTPPPAPPPQQQQQPITLLPPPAVDQSPNGAGAALAGGGPRVVFVPGLTEAQLATARCKLVDFGNGCWTYKQFTSDIQTRQYRWVVRVCACVRACVCACNSWRSASHVFLLYRPEYA